MHWIRTLAVALTGAALAGCASTDPASVLREGPRMIEIYRATAAAPAPGDRQVPQAAESTPSERGVPHAPDGDVAEAPKGAVTDGAVAQARCRWWWFTWPCDAPAAAPATDTGADAPTFARTAANELELLFPRLPNPDIYVYVPAHLATELRLPVPGYTTAVPLYDRVEYALPGERTAVQPGGEARLGGEAQPGNEALSGASAEPAP